MVPTCGEKGRIGGRGIFFILLFLLNMPVRHCVLPLLGMAHSLSKWRAVASGSLLRQSIQVTVAESFWAVNTVVPSLYRYPHLAPNMSPRLKMRIC